MKFELTESQIKKLEQWKEQLEKKMLDNDPQLDRFKTGHVYYGCGGGGYTFEITPTGLGDIVVVKEYFTKEELDLTEW